MNDIISSPDRFFDLNKKQFDKVKLICKDFPKIFGEIYVAMFAENGIIKIGNGVVINSAFEANPVGGKKTCFLFKGDGAVIEIGDNVAMSNVTIAAMTSVVIGNGVFLGGGVKIFDTDFHSVDYEERVADISIPSSPVEIADKSFIGADAMILKGVRIGERSVVGARSLVSKSIPDGEIWAGNPAKFTKKL